MSDFDTLFGYATAFLVTMGGAMGFAKKGSVASLISGGGSGLALAYGVRKQTVNRKDVTIVVVVSLILLGIMGPKAYRTQKLMPAGLVTILSAILLVRFGMRLL